LGFLASFPVFVLHVTGLASLGREGAPRERSILPRASGEEGPRHCAVEGAREKPHLRRFKEISDGKIFIALHR